MDQVNKSSNCCSAPMPSGVIGKAYLLCSGRNLAKSWLRSLGF